MSSGGGGGGDERGSGRLLTKLNDAMESQKFYEAHQLMKVINFRYTSAKKLSELEGLLNKTAITLLDYEQYESGSDVGILLTKLYINHSLPVNSTRIAETIILAQKMTCSPERQTFISNVLEWCGSSEVQLSGTFNAAITEIYIQEKSYPEAWKHLIRMSDSNKISTYTFTIIGAQGILPSEWDLVIANLILSILLTGKRFALAQDAYEQLLKRLPGEPSPLLNAVRFLIDAARRLDLPAFKTLKQIYWPSFRRDPNIHRLVESIGKTIFKLPDSNRRNGFMSNVMNALMAGEGSDESMSIEQGQSEEKVKPPQIDQMGLD